MDLNVIELAGPVTCARLQGRLDAAGADAIGLRFTAAVAAPGRDAIIDLSGVSFVASMGLRLLIATARSLSQKGRRVALFGATEGVQVVLEDAALGQIMPVVSTEAEAFAALRA